MCHLPFTSRYLALGSSLPWRSRSVGFVGQSDGFQQLSTTGLLDPQYQRADDGNVAITADEIGFGDQNRVDLVLGFGQSETEAGANVLESLRSGLPGTGHAWAKQDRTLTRFAYGKLAVFFERHLKY